MTDSFLAKSLMGKLEGTGVHVAFTHAAVGEIETVSEGTELFILIGDEAQYDLLMKLKQFFAKQKP